MIKNLDMFQHFPDSEVDIQHNHRDYYIIAFAFIVVAVCFFIDSIASQQLQLALGLGGWAALLFILAGECKYVRAQVFVAVTFATIGENFASIFMEGYTYRLQNVPAFVPPGHGIVYLTAVVLGRSGVFQQYARQIAYFVVLTGGVWALLALFAVIGRKDEIGAILFAVYLLYLFKGRSPMVYLGAFFITTWVELVGTSFGTWNWAAIDPASTLAQGNPPSGVAAWYCLVDAVAMGSAPAVLTLTAKILSFFNVSDPAKEEESVNGENKS